MTALTPRNSAPTPTNTIPSLALSIKEQDKENNRNSARNNSSKTIKSLVAKSTQPHKDKEDIVPNDIQIAAKGVAAAKRVVVVTGAGISVSGGIPDFRSVDGLYNLVKAKYPQTVVKGKDMFDATLFTCPISTGLFYTFMAELKQVIRLASSTPTHDFIRWLKQDKEKLLRCYTQNIDCIEDRFDCFKPPLASSTNDIVAVKSSSSLSSLGFKKSSSSSSSTSSSLPKAVAPKIIKLHGDMDNVICNLCKTVSDFKQSHLEVFSRGEPPSCLDCQQASEKRMMEGKRAIKVGTLRPNIILYNEYHSGGDQIAHVLGADLRRRPDLLIVMGTSLKVVGVRKLVKDISKSIKDSATASSSSSSSVAATTHKCILINKTELGKEWDNVFDLVILGETDAVCGEIRRQVEELHAAQSLKAEKARIKKEQKLAASATASTVAEKATLKSLSGPTTPLRSSLLAKQQQQQQQQPTGFGKLGFRSSKKLQPVVKITSSTVTATSPSSVGSSKQTHSTVDVGGNDIIPLRKAVAVVNSGGVGGCLPLAVSSPPSKSAVEAALKRSFIPSPIKKTAFAAIENCSSSISMQQKFKKKE